MEENKIILMEDKGIATFSVVGAFVTFYSGAGEKHSDLPDQFEEMLNNYLNSRSKKDWIKVVVDLKDCLMVNTSSLTVLIKAHKQIVDKLGGQFVIMNVGEGVRVLFEMTRLFHFFKVCSPEQLAEVLI